jgi:hypothetical protein
MTSGEQGKLLFYNIDSAEKTQSYETADVFGTCIANVSFFYLFLISQSLNDKFVAVCNEGGQIFIFDTKDDFK